MEQAGIGKDQGTDPAYALGSAGVLGRGVECVRNWLLEVVVFDERPDALHYRGDFVGLPLAFPAEFRRSGDAGVDAAAANSFEDLLVPIFVRFWW